MPQKGSDGEPKKDSRRGTAFDKSVGVRGLGGSKVSDLIELALVVPQGGISFLLSFIGFLFLLSVQHLNPFHIEIARRGALLVRTL